MGKKKRNKNKRPARPQKQGKQGVFVAVVVALTIGLFIGGVFVPALQTNGTPQQSAPTPSSGGGGTNYDQQIATVKGQIEAQPNSASLHAKLGNLYFDSKQHAKAIEAYTRSLEIDPDNPHVTTDLGVMYRRNGQPQKAIESFDKAIAISPVHETARFNKGIVLYYDLDDRAGALKAWNGLIKLNPNAKAPNGQLIKDMIRSM